MSSPDGEVWVVYNGEIFNFAALREELLADGWSFRSQSDTEVLPLLYLKYGDRMVEQLNGIFAFAIWDSRQQKLLVARDRMGVKPLYYATCRRPALFCVGGKVPAACSGIASGD